MAIERAVAPEDLSQFVIEIFEPQSKLRGQFSSNAALKLASHFELQASSLAQAIANNFNHDFVDAIEVEDGFLNFHLSPYAFASVVHAKLLKPSINTVAFDCAQKWHINGQMIATKSNPQFLVHCTWSRLSAALDPHLSEPYAEDISSIMPAFDKAVVGDLISAHQDLALLLDGLDMALDRSRELDSPMPLERYVLRLAELLDGSNILTGLYQSDHSVRNCRIGLIHAAKRVLTLCLGILNVSALGRL